MSGSKLINIKNDIAEVLDAMRGTDSYSKVIEDLLRQDVRDLWADEVNRHIYELRSKYPDLSVITEYFRFFCIYALSSDTKTRSKTITTIIDGLERVTTSLQPRKSQQLKEDYDIVL